ncbi:hypothetical protein C8R47DRAFT_1104262 [Mycena vitilis]|nr:hypothetical protein C8R47DRAFT_1104262 [Mycena vitilis]
MPPTPTGYNCTDPNDICAIGLPTGVPGYLTYGLVDSVAACAKMCNETVKGCLCFNTYHDNNAGSGKNNTLLLTCSMFSVHVTKANATNCGMQQQQSLPKPVTNITESYTFCKPKAT